MVEAVDDVLDRRPVGLGVVEPALVDVAGARLAEVGEVEAALVVEDDVVRAPQPEPVALGVEVLDLAGGDVDPLDPAADVVGWLRPGDGHAVDLGPLEAAVVADVDLAVGADGGAVGTAAGLGDLGDRAVGGDAGQRAALDLDDHDAAVVHGDRALGEPQPTGDLTKLSHFRSSPYWARERGRRTSAR